MGYRRFHHLPVVATTPGRFGRPVLSMPVVPRVSLRATVASRHAALLHYEGRPSLRDGRPLDSPRGRRALGRFHHASDGDFRLRSARGSNPQPPALHAGALPFELANETTEDVLHRKFRTLLGPRMLHALRLSVSRYSPSLPFRETAVPRPWSHGARPRSTASDSCTLLVGGRPRVPGPSRLRSCRGALSDCLCAGPARTAPAPSQERPADCGLHGVPPHGGDGLSSSAAFHPVARAYAPCRSLRARGSNPAAVATVLRTAAPPWDLRAMSRDSASRNVSCCSSRC